MIDPATGPLDSTARELRGLYLSLNSPVLALGTLPVGPAAAAVAVHAPPTAGATLAIRSARTGTVVFYTVADDDGGLAAGTVLAFAESLGFLFEEDAGDASGLVRSEGRRAERRWREWIGDAPHDEAAEVPPADDPALGLSKFRCPLGGAGSNGFGLDLRLELSSRF